MAGGTRVQMFGLRIIANLHALIPSVPILRNVYVQLESGSFQRCEDRSVCVEEDVVRLVSDVACNVGDCIVANPTNLISADCDPGRPICGVLQVLNPGTLRWIIEGYEEPQ